MKKTWALSVFLLLALAATLRAATLTVVEVQKSPAVAQAGGEWERAERGGATYLASGQPGAGLRFEFTGVSVAIVFGEGPKGGRCIVTLDGKAVEGFSPVDTKRRFERSNDWLVARNLAAGKHVLEITVAADTPRDSKVCVYAIKYGDFAFGVISGDVHPPVAAAARHYPAVGVTVEALRNGKAVMSAVSGDDAPGWRMAGLEPGHYTMKCAPNPLWTRSLAVDVDLAAGGHATADLPVLNRLIWLPRPTCPAFALRGDSFECVAFASPLARDWSASMTNGLKTFNLNVAKVGCDPARGLQRLRVTVPRNAPAELYALTLKSSEGADTVERAVKVLAEFRKRYTIAHLTDVHSEMGPVIEACFKKEIDEINLLRPEFVIITGDVVESVNEASMAKFFKMLNAIDVPTFVTAGNHDHYVGERYTSGQYREAISVRWLGAPQASFDYGDAHVILYDDGYAQYEVANLQMQNPLADGEVKGWVEADLSKRRASALRIVACHVGFAFSQTIRKDLDALGVNLLLYGHDHQDSVDTTGHTPLRAIQTRSNQVIIKGMGPGYRLIGVDDGKVAFFAYDGEKVNAMPVPQNADVADHALRVVFSGPNDGTANGLTATITNGYDQRFDDARVKFLVAKDVYAARGGRVVERYESDNGETSVVIVSVDLPAKGEASVRLIPLHPQ